MLVSNYMQLAHTYVCVSKPIQTAWTAFTMESTRVKSCTCSRRLDAGWLFASIGMVPMDVVDGEREKRVWNTWKTPHWTARGGMDATGRVSCLWMAKSWCLPWWRRMVRGARGREDVRAAVVQRSCRWRLMAMCTVRVVQCIVVRVAIVEHDVGVAASTWCRWRCSVLVDGRQLWLRCHYCLCECSVREVSGDVMPLHCHCLMQMMFDGVQLVAICLVSDFTINK